MEARGEREALAQLADRLCGELGYASGAELPEEAPSASGAARTRLFADQLGPEEEQLVATARQSLARIAAALATRHPPEVSETAARALLEGAEVVLRNELAAGKQVSSLMPGFVFLVVLPMVDQDQALELARRTAELLGEEI